MPKLPNHTDPCNLDLSLFLEYSPTAVLEFFQHGAVHISLSAYRELKNQFADPANMNENVTKWVLFIDKMLDVEADLADLDQNRHILFVGPYYYLRTNTRLYFFKTEFEHEGVTSKDLVELLELSAVPVTDEAIARYYSMLKVKPSPKKTRDDLLNDLSICINAMTASEKVQAQTQFQQRLIEQREAFLNAPYTALAEPESPGEKPQKPDPSRFTVRSLFSRERAQTESYAQLREKYNHDLKVYFINYREYEKACDRYKMAVKEWETEKSEFINRSIEDIKRARLKLKKADRVSRIYREVIQSPDIHPQYRNIEALQRFQFFLQSGRASNLQECMNLYEQEMHWADLKQSQSRLERNILATVYFLRSEAAASIDPSDTETPDSLIENIVRRLRDGHPESKPD
ncbi:MAG: hypothetical protein ACM3QZ_02730 [Solirubrobacterales bacterium]